MSQIRGRDTKPEVALRRALWSAGLRYRLHARVFGRPDIVFSRSRVAVFCDGCFWHGCPEHSVKPKTNSLFWLTKLAKNKARDERVVTALRAEGWTVLRFWEHEIEKDAAQVAQRVMRAVKKHSKHPRRRS